ncbi:MAG TPA: hypothetical protein VLB76_20490 [Thermoanaerobaculia bacterium]|jgi:hypothetical protein|nr:hypothetical protein [Thermoanaerobaculia bacterium]
MTAFAFAPLSRTLSYWPKELFGDPGGLLDEIGVTDFKVLTDDDTQAELTGTVAWLREIELKLPSLDAISVAFLSTSGFTQLDFKVRLAPDFQLTLINLKAAIRLRSGFLRPVHKDADGKWVPTLDKQGQPVPAEFELSGADATVSADGDVGLVFPSGAPSLSLPPIEFGNSGLVLEMSGIQLYLSESQPPPAGAHAGFKGLAIGHATLYLSGGIGVSHAPDTVSFTNLLIGSSGFSGRIQAGWTTSYDPVAGTFSGSGGGKLFGIEFGLESLDFTFQQNVPTDAALHGTIKLPFFDEPTKVEIGIGVDDGFHVKLAATGTNGLYKLTKPNLLEIELDSLAFEIKDGLFTTKLSGQLTPLFGNDKGLKWPTFDVKDLTIDSKGHVHLPGGWLSLAQQKTFDFHGFQIEISQIGFGKTDDGGKWIGFSGGLHLVDGLQAGASVEGLRITWHPGGEPKITLNGAGVELSIPDVLYLKGEVSFREIENTVTHEVIRRFDGHIHLSLEEPELEIDGTLVIGSVKGPQGRYNFFAIYVDADIPGGIALASTGLAIYGFAGLFALQMEPDKHPDEMWFSIDHSKSFFHRGTPGITDIKTKWRPTKGSFAVGLGITLGTLPDSGYSFNGKFLLAIVIPGPVLLLQGAAQFLKKRVGAQDEAKFRALAVLDGRAGNLLIGLDAEYKKGTGGELIDISGSMEAFYSFNDPMAWHLWLGKRDPRSQRIRALFAKLVEADAYFMLDAHQLALGVWYGFNNGWNFGPLSVRLEAWVDGNALVSFKPSQFHGDLWLHGLVDLKAFGFGFGLVLDAKITADLFKPYHLRGEFSVGVKLPWPFKKKKLAARIVLEWGPRPEAPPLPLPVATIGIEHLKSSAKWSLPRGTFLLPSYDDGEGFLTAPGTGTEPSEAAVPQVPVDSRIAVTFGRSVHDGAKVGSNLQAIYPDYETIGDPGSPNGSVLKVRYVLDTVTLARKVGNGWQTVAASPAGAGSGPPPPPLWGQWSVVPQLPDQGGPSPRQGQTKLLLGAKTPFEFNRHTGSSWEEWVSDALPGYPCVPVQPGKETCFGFGGLQPQSAVTSPWTFPGPPAVTLSWGFGPATVGTRTVARGEAIQKIPLLCFPEAAMRHGIRVQSEAPGTRFRLLLAQTDSQPGTVFEPQPLQPGPNPGTRGARLESVPVPVTPAPPVELPVDPGVLIPRVVPGPTLPGPGGQGPPREVPVDGTVVVPREAMPTCVNVRARAAGTLANPWKAEEGARFTVRGADGALLPVARIERWDQGELGLNAGFELDIDLPCPAAWVTLLVTHRPPFRIVAYNAAGTAVATHAPNGTGGTSTETIRLDGPAMTRVVVHASGNEKLIHQVCFLCPRLSGPQATGFGADGTSFGPFGLGEGGIQVVGPEIHGVVITGDGPLCLEQVCVTPDPEAGQVVRQDERIQHQLDELDHWQAEGEVLAPDSFYRLTVQTHLDLDPMASDLTGVPADRSPVEHAYFRTGGPPGLTRLTTPEGVTTDPFQTGLEDLTRYVRETTPPTVPPPGEKPILFKPFYRAYDVGVEFNEDYVEQMYRMDRRDLGLYLYDASNQPARDGLGRLLALSGEWGKAETLSLSERETRWITMIDAASCLPKKLDPQTFPKDDALASSDPGRVLAPDTLHEARLVPLLLHESFPGDVLGGVPDGWYAEDAGPGGSSSWKVGEAGEPPSRFVEQLSPIGGVASPDRPGTLLLLAGAAGWTDYRLSVYLRAPAGAVGVVVRYQGPGTGYRFSLDGRVRRMVKGGATLLAEDHFAYRKNRDSLVTVEAIGGSLRAYVDGELVFDIEDGDFAAGGIGLYSCQSPGARFTDVRVDDLGKAAPVVYRFQLTTSLYANFFHHLHSYQDETWKADLGTDPAVDALLNEAVAPSFSPPPEQEARAYEDLAQRALGSAARQNPAQVEVTRLEKAGAPVAFLLRSPEPLAWDRVEFALSGTPRHLPAPEVPGTVKLTDAAFGAVLPSEESATLLLREATDLSRYRVELRALPGVLAEPAGDPVLLAERFGGDPATALARFTVVDQGTANGPSDWRVEGGALIQISEIGGGAEPELPGTVALAGDPAWTDYRYMADLRCDSGGALGVVFRWVDADNHYRLSLDAGLKYRRLVKREKGQVSVLWESGQGYTAGELFRLTVEAVGSRLTGFLGGDRLFQVTDVTHAAGLVGLYCAGNPDARFEAIEVRRPSLDAYALARDQFAADDLAGWGRVDEAPGSQASTMKTAGGELILSSFVAQGSSPDDPGTYAYTGEGGWTDVIYSARLRCPAGAAIGLVFRGRDLKNYYRLSMSAGSAPYRRLIKRVNGAATVLWQDGGSYAPDRAHELAVVAVGGSLRGYLDGVPLFAVQDGDVPSGLIGLYARDNPDARFSQVRVLAADRAFAGWLLDEPFDALVPGRWSFFDAQEKPWPESWTIEAGALRPAGADPSTPHLALTGDPAAADYRLAVRVRPGGDGGLVGAAFRYVDGDNGLLFFLDAGSGDQRLVKKVKGQETVLWQGKGAITAGREVGLTFDAVGERLAGWLDGQELFRLDDADLPAGRVGFFAAGNPEAHFTEVRLAAPEWTVWYAFGGEDRLPAGTRVRVHAGAEAGAASSEAGVERRFAAPLGEAGRLRFPSGGAELRVVAPAGPGHRRTFVPPTEHVPLANPKMVRRADGTGLVLLPFGNPAPLLAGQYRVELTWHRERSGQVHPFSQAGDRTPERAVIDIPWQAR